MGEHTISPAGDPFYAAPHHPGEHDLPCACYSGWIFITYEDEHGEERDVSYPCRRCEEKR